MRFRALLLVAIVTVACGGGPTQPAVVTTPQVSTNQSGEPAPPPPATPTPSPSPTPGPSPTPTPTPTPAPERWQGTATVAEAHWYQTPAPVADSFAVQWNQQALTFGSMTTPVLAWNEKDGAIGVFARPRGMNLQIVFNPSTGTGTWILSGEPGQATGSVAVAR